MKQPVTVFSFKVFPLSMILVLSCFSLLKATEPIHIFVRNEEPTIQFAADELSQYLKTMASDNNAVLIERKKTDSDKAGLPNKTALPIIEVGLFSDFNKPKMVEDPIYDDAYSIHIDQSRGTIIGSNPRSVLFGVYRFLESQGCRWIRPGKPGEIIPQLGREKVANGLVCQIDDKAFYRFRGVNNCGVFSLEQFLDKVDWCAKMGMNTIFCEFMFSRHFYNRYYGREYPSLLPKEPKTDKEIWVYHNKNIEEIKKRGMFYHAVGHGWTGRVVGASEEDCDHDSRPKPDPDKVKYLALWKGKRSMDGGPTFTDLCYGNPETFNRLVQLVVDYAAKHPEVDYLHFWLDDQTNNSCECPLCKDLQPTDTYVRLLNAIDAELTRKNLKTKLVFLAYTELLWPPKKERFTHPERFIFMYAPVTRNYEEPYFIENVDDVKIPQYGMNQYVLPNDMKVGSALLKGWQKCFSGPAFTFDYHMVWHHYRDFGYYDFAKVMAEDIRRLPQLGMQGYISCQIVNTTFPHGFPMYLHAKMLWNPKNDFDDLAREYFQSAFGPQWKSALTFFKRLSESSIFAYDPPQDQTARKIMTDKLSKIPMIVAEFSPEVERVLKSPELLAPAQLQSWRMVKIYNELTDFKAHALLARFQNNSTEEKQYWQKYTDLSAHTESDTAGMLDLYWSGSYLPVMNMKPH